MFVKLVSYLLISLSFITPLFAQSPFEVIPAATEYRLAADKSEVAIDVLIRFPSDHYLFADKTKFDLQGVDALNIGPLIKPRAQTKYDRFLKKDTAVYRAPEGERTAEIRLSRLVRLPAHTDVNPASSFILMASVTYQGCNPKLCYLPMNKSWSIKLMREPAGATASKEKQPADKSDGDWNFAEIAKRGWLIALLLAFVGGLISSLTPCVYPMIPITIAVIGAKQTTSKWRSLFIGGLFALGLAFTYAVLGLVAASSGNILGAALQNRLVVLLIFIIFVAMGLSMLGVFDFRLPYFVNRLVTKLDGKGGNVGVFITGMVTGVVAAPCVGPVILGILTFVATTANPLLGFSLLFSFALGLSTLFVMLGVFSSMLQQLPKSGAWMDSVKHLFGIVLIGVGVYYIRPILEPVYFYALITLLLVVLALLSRKKNLFGKRGSIVVYLLSLICAFSVFFGSVLPRLGDSPKDEHKHSSEKGSVVWQTDLQAALAQAKNESRPVMIDFFAEWCLACKELDETTFVDPQVIELAKDFVNIKLDFTELDSDKQQIMQRYNVLALPVILFFNSKGENLIDERVDGYIDAKAMQEKLKRVTGR